MPVVRLAFGAALWCALVVVGCRGTTPNCPVGEVSADPREIPDGSSETTLLVEVYNPTPENELEVITELSAGSGIIEDPFARETIYTCAFDVSGVVDICVETRYASEDDEDDGEDDRAPKRRGPNVYLQSPTECSNTRCTQVICPDVKNECPAVNALDIEPEFAADGTASITVDAVDPDDNPEPLTTTLSARHGTIDDPHATETTYTCDPEVGGIIPICVDASDGACTETVCESVRCPGEPLENTCPIINLVTASPNPIEAPQDTTSVVVSATDPDEFPEPLTTQWSSEGGGFEDDTAPQTTFRCTRPGPVQVCVMVNDGDPSCLDDPNTMQCLIVECPGGIIPNVCPNLNVINPIPRVIESPETSTTVQTRGWDTDESPFPLVLTLSALWGTFENTENMMCDPGDLMCGQSENVVFQNATYICDRPGAVELCVDATDGECTKTLCTNVFCPDDIVPP